MGKQKKDKIGEKCDGCRRLLAVDEKTAACETASGIIEMSKQNGEVFPHPNCPGWDARKDSEPPRKYGVLVNCKLTGELSCLGLRSNGQFAELVFTSPLKTDAIAALINVISHQTLEAHSVEFVKKEDTNDDIDPK